MTAERDREKLYWSCQALGWFSYAGVNALLFATSNFGVWAAVFVPILFCSIGFGITHALRRIFKRLRWTQLSIQSLGPRIVICSVVSAVVWEGLHFGVAAMFPPPPGLPPLSTGTMLSIGFSMSATLLIWQLIYFGFHYVENYRRADVERLRLEVVIKEAELASLRSQMNPHFIFNCLNNIRGLILEDPSKAQVVVTQLANILRYSLQTGSVNTVSLEDEMRTVADYLALEAVRLEDRLQVRMDIDPVTLRIKVPPMLVQTLVENGIKYGVADRVEGGAIQLTSAFKDDFLRVEVSSTGRFDEAVNPQGVGLKNSVERLKLLFGDKASIKLENSANDLVTATILIPVSVGKNEDTHRR